jgi:hypothetical protein
MEIRDILKQLGTFCIHLVHFCGFGTMHREKSGIPVSDEAREVFSGAEAIFDVRFDPVQVPLDSCVNSLREIQHE